MVILIMGASHTGKTTLAQKLLEKYKYPYFSIDHLKMGLIRSGLAQLTPTDDEKLTEFLWPILREMKKNVIENEQNLIVEGCYIPWNWTSDFAPKYRQHIQSYCLIMSENYIRNHFDDIQKYAKTEKRLHDDCSQENLWKENKHSLEMAQKFHLNSIFIGKKYEVSIEL